MMVLGGFITCVGIAAVASAFTLLVAVTLGTAGLVIASVGAAAVLAGVGLFGTGAYKNYHANPDITLDNATSLAIA